MMRQSLAPRARAGVDVVQLPHRQHRRSHEPEHGGPPEHDEHRRHRPEALAPQGIEEDDAGQDQRDGEHDVGEPGQTSSRASLPLYPEKRTEGHRDERGEEGDDETDRHRGAGPADGAGVVVATLQVGAEPMLCVRCLEGIDEAAVRGSTEVNSWGKTAMTIMRMMSTAEMMKPGLRLSSFQASLQRLAASRLRRSERAPPPA